MCIHWNISLKLLGRTMQWWNTQVNYSAHPAQVIYCMCHCRSQKGAVFWNNIVHSAQQGLWINNQQITYPESSKNLQNTLKKKENGLLSLVKQIIIHNIGIMYHEWESYIFSEIWFRNKRIKRVIILLALLTVEICCRPAKFTFALKSHVNYVTRDGLLNQ